jgi:hypothetical protein
MRAGESHRAGGGMTITKERVDVANAALTEMFDAIPKSKRFGYLGHLNKISLVIEELQRQVKKQGELFNENKK